MPEQLLSRPPFTKRGEPFVVGDTERAADSYPCNAGSEGGSALAPGTTLVKAIGLGRSLWKVGGTADFDSVAAALEKVVDVSGAALAGGSLSKSLAARHCALVVAA